jgi:glyoxylase-like metal-dependent hydrolase (beta-lactamase superfamily II)
MRIGSIEVEVALDGVAVLPPEVFTAAPEAWHAHRDQLDADGVLRLPIGAFVVRTGEQLVLIDAGVGDVHDSMFEGGALLDSLAALGVTPADVDTVLCTHLHDDHCGWLVHDGRPTFPTATVRFGALDWQHFVVEADPGDRRRRALEVLAAADRVQPIDHDGEAVAPGITARSTPGHTPGHTGFVVASGDDRAMFLGDVIHCPVQLAEPDWQFIFDVDADRATATREALLRELEGTDTWAVPAHFPGLQAGRVLPGKGRRYWS